MLPLLPLAFSAAFAAAPAPQLVQLPLTVAPESRLPVEFKTTTARSRITTADCALALEQALSPIKADLDKGWELIGAFPGGWDQPSGDQVPCKLLGKANKPEGAQISLDLLLGKPGDTVALTPSSRVASLAFYAAKLTEQPVDKVSFVTENGGSWLLYPDMSTDQEPDRLRLEPSQRAAALIESTIEPWLSAWQPALAKVPELAGVRVDVMQPTTEGGKAKRTERTRLYIPTALAAATLAGRIPEQAFADGLNLHWAEDGKAASLVPLKPDATTGGVLQAGVETTSNRATLDDEPDDLLDEPSP